MYSYHRDRIRRAGTIWSMQARNLADSDPERAARCAIRSAFARASWFQHLDARSDDVGPVVEAALSHAILVRAMNTSLYQLGETLMACSDRKAAIDATNVLLMLPAIAATTGSLRKRLRDSWINIYDPIDVVSRPDPRLNNDFRNGGEARVHDIRQNNSGIWTHSMTRYLERAPLRRSLRDAFDIAQPAG